MRPEDALAEALDRDDVERIGAIVAEHLWQLVQSSWGLSRPPSSDSPRTTSPRTPRPRS